MKMNMFNKVLLVLALMSGATVAQNPVNICGSGAEWGGTQVFETILEIKAYDSANKVAWDWVSENEYTIRVTLKEGASKSSYNAFYMKSVGITNLVDSDNFVGSFVESSLPANTQLISSCKADGAVHPMFGSTVDGSYGEFEVTWVAPTWNEGDPDIGAIYFYLVVDWGDNSFSDYVVQLTIHGGEVFPDPFCGPEGDQGIRQTQFPEQCEEGEVRLCGTLNSGWNSGRAECYPDDSPEENKCRWDTSACFFRYCGDGHLNHPAFAVGVSASDAEHCDLTAIADTGAAADPSGQHACVDIVAYYGDITTLVTYTNLDGWEGGTYTCGDDCRWDLSNCYRCYDGIVSGIEQCEGSGSITCAEWDAQFNMGISGFNLGDAVCIGCQYDISGCSVATTAFCGDGIMNQDSEECDTGGDLTAAVRTCQQHNRDFDYGDVTCSEECLIVTDGCSDCGDGKAEVEKGEECEFGEQLHCQTWDLQFGDQIGPPFGEGWYNGGFATCTVRSCEWVYDNCYHISCGDGLDEPDGETGLPEECDPQSPNTAVVSCGDLPAVFQPLGALFSSGTATCTNTCQYDLSGCVAEACGDGVVNQANEQCDLLSSRPGTFQCRDLDAYGNFHSGIATCTDGCTLDLTPCITCEDIYLDCLTVAMQDCGADEDDCLCFNRAMKCASDQGCCNEVQDVCRAAFTDGYPLGDPYPRENSLGESYGINGNEFGRTCSADIACHCGLVGEYGICPVVLIECPTSWVQQNCVARDRNDMCRAPNCPGISEQMMIEQFNCRYAYDYDGDNSPDNDWRGQRYPDGTLGEHWVGYPYGAPRQTGQNWDLGASKQKKAQ